MNKVLAFISSCFRAYRRSITGRLLLANGAYFTTVCTVLGIACYVTLTVIARQNQLTLPTTIALPLILFSVFFALLSALFWYGLSHVRDKP